MSSSLYKEIINEIYGKRKLLNKSIGRLAKNDNFSGFFSKDLPFKEKFYDYFGISGASLMIADSLKKKIILLQDGFEDADNLPTLEMPVSQNKDLPSSLMPRISNLTEAEYNFFVNRIFQIQRKSEEYWGTTKVPVYTNVPEFDIFRDEDNEFYSGSVSRVELLKSFLIWRFLIWAINLPEASISIDDMQNLDLEILHQENTKIGKYFLTNNIRSKFKDHITLPEWSVDDLSNQKVWNNNTKVFSFWEELSNKVDSLNKNFIEELDILNELTSSEIIEKLNREFELEDTEEGITVSLFHQVLKEFLSSIDIKNVSTIPDLLEILHSNVPMLIPYYYFSLIDNRVKSHYAFSIWKAPELAFEYYDKDNNLKLESSIFNCVVSLNIDIDNDKQLELKTAIKLITENVINEIIIGQSIRSEQRNDRYQFERTILLSKINNKKGVFVLGLNEERITFVAQQSRALNLIRALHEIDVLNQSKSLAIIGAGVSGINAAAAAFIAGVKKIEIFEKSNEILSFQSEAFHREIHPNIYDWPNTLYDHKETRFPFLNWSAASAPYVLNEIRDKFNALVKESNQTIKIRLNSEVSNIESYSSSKYQIRSSKNVFKDFDIVIVAIGQGEERIIDDLNNINHSTYWVNDDLHKVPADIEFQILVSGSGDGALIDIMRAKLNLDHNQMLKFTNHISFRKLGFEMLKVDRGFIRDSYLNVTGNSLYERYKENVYVENAAYECLEYIRSYLKSNIIVSHFTRSQRMKVDTALINRMFVFLLHIDKNIKVDFTKWSEVTKSTCEKTKTGYRYVVSYNMKTVDGIILSQGKAEFNKVFFRHGTDLTTHYNRLNLLNEFSLNKFLSEETIDNRNTGKDFVQKLNSVGVTFLSDIDDFVISETLTGNSETFRLNLTNYVTKDTSKWYEDCIYRKKLEYLYYDIK